MTSGLIFGFAIVTLALVIVVGLLRRSREAPVGARGSVDGPTAVAQWTEGETTRLLSSAEVPGLYLLRPAVPDESRKPRLSAAQGGVSPS